ncbi:MAG: dihydrodipicolinate synthase family protein [Planctomycetes bacterium]|nr:dihydrodipicolinate synthase family protein [Planctomycetota bacterium]
MHTTWQGMFPALTTQFRGDHSVDVEATCAHLEKLIDAGIDGVVMMGTVGENCSLEPEEKRTLLRAAVTAAARRIPVLSGVAEFTTAAACRFARDARELGADGLMVLPAMVYSADPREAMAHFRSVAAASDLPILCYNNPVSYGVDLLPQAFAELADVETLVAIKESSDDVRRLTDLVNTVGDRYVLFGGVDDLALESMLLGATGLVSGLVNAFPVESIRMMQLAQAGEWEAARAIYRWFTPLLHLDTHPKLVQYIKLVMQECGMGSEVVRPPRLELVGAEREQIVRLTRDALATRPRD